ncbi:hypothetical protein AVEN_19824-1 [Araneus ventricosus]|uniref:Uncharacterized protein n=1 Tax=Araneus ventricosus TaxID=182803 RepID=A0A4Y2QB88_ARAVE|nr:hypothetical protein AVEN_19824-1 [Araneus ventricosus]
MSSNCLLKNIFQNKVESSMLVYIIHRSRHVVCRWPSRNLNCFKLPPHRTSIQCLLTVKMEAVSIALRVPYSPANHQGLCPLWTASVSFVLDCKRDHNFVIVDTESAPCQIDSANLYLFRTLLDVILINTVTTY